MRYRSSPRKSFLTLRSASVESLEFRRLLSVSLVKDLNPTTNGVGPLEPTAVGSSVFFTTAHIGADGKAQTSSGQDLWRTDGTSSGTVRVSTRWTYGAETAKHGLIAFGGTLVYQARPLTLPSQLFEYDPSTDTTSQLTPFNYTGTVIGSPVLAGGSLYFTVERGTGVSELWASGGTVATTHVIAPAGVSFVSNSISSLTSVNGVLYFTANDTAHGVELWKSDGTDAGTLLVADINPGTTGSAAANLTAVGSSLYFTANDGAHGTELWSSDGTPGGTTMVSDIAPGTTGSSPGNLAAVGSTLFFSASDGSHGVELWNASGTSASLVKDAVAGTGGSSPANLTNLNGTLLYTATTSAAGSELWTSDGTSAGTTLLADINSGTAGSAISGVTVVNGKAFFAATDAAHGAELWKTDGTSAGTAMVSDVAVGTTSSSPALLTAFGSAFVFSANDVTHGTELWISDGTPGGTQLIKDIDSARRGIGTSGYVSFGSKVVYSIGIGPQAGLWITDGTLAGTQQLASGLFLANNGPGPGSAGPGALAATIGGTLYFASSAGGLWRTDGTAAGTKLISTFAAGGLSYFTAVGDRLFFSGGATASNAEPWTSDGTAAGTYLIKDLQAGSSGSFPQYFVPLNGQVYFAAQGSLWGTDGTSAGTVKVSGFNVANLQVLSAVVLDGAMYVLTYGTGGALWRSDGTTAGTVAVTSGIEVLINSFAKVLDHRIVFSGRVGGVTGIYGYDPTANTTSLLSTVVNPVTPVVSRGNLYFVANSGKDLWTLVAGSNTPTRVRTFSNGVSGILGAGGTLYAVGGDTGQASTLWQTDGSPAGTVQAFDAATAASLGPIFSIVAANDSVMFFGSPPDGNGADLWWISNAPTAPASPTNLVATAASGTDARLTWFDHADNEDGYLLQRSLVSDFSSIDASFSLPANSTFYTDAGRTPGATYFYRLTAVAGSLTSAAATASVTMVLSPAAPTGLSATAISPTQINLGWSDNSSDETGFLLERSLYATFASIDATYTLAANATSTGAFSDTTVIKNTRYYYRVRAVNAAGNSSASTATAQTPDAAPAAPTNLVGNTTGISFGGYGATLTWTNNADNASGFVIERKTEPSGSFAVLATVPNYQFGYGDQSVLVGGRYTYRVRAQNAVGFSAYSNSVSVTVAPIGGSPVADINPNGSSNPGSLTAFNGQVFFAAEDIPHGRELWKSDGTSTGTTLVSDINPQGAGSYPSDLTVMGSTLYFSAYDGAQAGELWKTDGTSTGTKLVTTVPGTNSHSLLGFVAGTSTLYFLVTSDSRNYSLWRSDGTAAGTTPVGTNVFPDFSLPNLGMTVVGDTLYFAASSPAAGQELWKADASGASLVADIYSGAGGSNPTNLTASGSSLYFFASDTAGPELFKVDSSTGTTSKVFGPLETTNTPGPLVATTDGSLYFTASWQGRLQVLKSDGTTAGTVTLQSLVPSYTATGGSNLTVSGNSVYFFAGSSLLYPSGSATYKTDGTVAGTTAVASLGTASNATYVTAGGYFYVGINNLSRTDGSSIDFIQKLSVPGETPASSFAVVGGDLYFSANPDLDNRELYKVASSLPAAPSALAVSLPANGTAQLTWTDSANNEAGFWIDRSRTPDFSIIDAVLWAPANATTAFDTGYTPATTNYYRIRAFNAAGESSNSASTSLAAPPTTTDPQPVVIPPAPVRQLQTFNNNGSVGLQWGRPSGTTGYMIERSLDGMTYSIIATVPVGAGIGEGYQDTSGMPSVYYWYRVTAFNAASAAAPSSASRQRAGRVVPDQLATFLDTDTTSGGTWANRLGDQNYAVAGNVENITVSGQTPILWAASTADPRALQKADLTTDRIAAAWSSTTSFTLNVPVYGYGTSESVYAVDWDNAGRVERFDVIDTTNNAVLSSQTISNFQNGVYLRWNLRGREKIVVTNLAGPNAVVSGWFAQTLSGPVAPTNLVATPSFGSVDLSWTDNATNEEATWIERSSDNIYFSYLDSVGPNVTSYSDTSGTPGGIYYYRVRTYNSWGVSSVGASQAQSALPASEVPPPVVPDDGGSASSNVVRASPLAPHAPTLTAVTSVVGSPFVRQIVLTGNYFVASSAVTLVNKTTGQTLSTADTAADHPIIVSRTTSGLVVQGLFGSAASNWTAQVTTSFGTSAAIGFTVSAAPAIAATAIANKGKPTVNLGLIGVPTGVTLSYSWRVTAVPAGAPAVLFSANNSASAATSIATLGRAGVYTFAVKISDGVATHTIERTVTLTDAAALTALSLSPATIMLARGAKQQFAVTAKDQFGLTFTPLPAITWSIVTGGSGGTLSTTGLYTAPASVSGSTTIKAIGGGLSATAVVTIAAPAFTSAKIDFAPSASTIATGYQRDSGAVYGVRSTTLTYGWNLSHASTAVDRNKNANQLLDTNIGILSGGRWELAVPNGKYTVKVGVGDSAVATTNTIRVESLSLYAAAKQSANVFSSKTITVTVADGKLTLDAGSAASSVTRIDYVEVTKV